MRITAIFLFFLSIQFLLGIFLIHWGSINPDEGYYLYAAFLNTQGKTPYTDFSFTQAPVFPFFYGAIARVWDYGFTGGRFISLCLSLLTSLMIYWLVWQTKGTTALFIAGMLTVFNTWHLYYHILANGYSLTAFLLVLSIFNIYLTRSPWLLAIGSIGAGLLAGGTRLSALPASIVVFAFLLYLFFKEKIKKSPLFWAFFSGWIVVFLLPSICGWESFLYNAVIFHLKRDIGNWREILLGKFTFLYGFAKSYFWLFFVLLSFFLLDMKLSFREWWKEDKRINRFEALYLWIIISITIAHLFSKVTFRDAHYQEIIVPIFILGIAIYGARVWDSLEQGRWKSFLALLFIIGSLLQPFFQGRVMLTISRGKSPIKSLKDVVKIVQYVVPPYDKIITEDTFIAFEAKRLVVDGFEGCFLHPHLSDELAKKYHLLNINLLKEKIKSREAKALIIKESSFKIAYPYFHKIDDSIAKEIWNLIEDNYQLVFMIKEFGKWKDTELIYLRKSDIYLNHLQAQ